MSSSTSHTHNHSTTKPSSKLLWAFYINLIFLIVEVVGGLLSGSMALLADAGHMVSDVLALGTAAWVSKAMLAPATGRKSYGFGRLEVLSGLVNGLILWGVVVWIMIEAFDRFLKPEPIVVEIMLPVAIAGLLANLVSAWILFSEHDADLNKKQAFLHLMSDAAGSVGAIVAGIALLSGGWLWLDPLVSIMIGILIFISSLSVVRQSFHILLEGAPPDIDCEVIREVLNQQDEIEEAHDIHAWMIGSNEMMLTAHFVPTVGYSSQSALESAKQAVQEHFDIRHVTFQVESSRCSVSHD
jgi:cobalt-zinc-cadmium efflux system protein